MGTIAHHVDHRILNLERGGSVLKVSTRGVPVGERAHISGHVKAPPIGSEGGDGVGWELVESMRGNDLLRAWVNQCYAGPVGSSPVVADDDRRSSRVGRRYGKTPS